MTESNRSFALKRLNSRPEALRTVAIMEDNPEIADFVKRQLELAHYNVLSCVDLSDCMYLAEHGCRTFILDIHMGDDRTEEGIAALKSLKAFDRGIFCILLTHHRDERFRKEARDFGCDAFLNKSGRDLISAFDQVLMALDRMWLGQATNLSFDPIHRPLADEIVRRVEALRESQIVFPDDSRKQSLLTRYRDLSERYFDGALTETEKNELDSVTVEIEALESIEAEETDIRNAAGRAGRLDATLDRIGDLLREWKASKG